MNIEFRNLSEKQIEIWNMLIHSIPSASFLSTPEWADFLRKRGSLIDQQIIYLDGTPAGVITIEIHKRRIAKYAYAPYGPVIDWSKFTKEELTEFLRYFSSWALLYVKEKGLNSFKFDPKIDRNNIEIFNELAIPKSLSPGQAIDIWVSEIKDKNYKDILKDQHKSTRYEIKKAQKKGVKVFEAKTKDDVSSFADLMEETMARKEFITHPRDYYIEQWNTLNSKGITRIWLATYQDTVVAGALMNYFQHEVSYAFGASTSDKELQKLSAPYYLHAKIMEDAASKGFFTYNFWGVVPKEVGEHAMRGLSDFKMKFKGRLVRFVGPHELRRNTPAALLQRASEFYLYKKERY